MKPEPALPGAQAQTASQPARCYQAVWISMAKLYLGNLSEGCQKEDVQDAFARFGAIEAIWIARKPPGVTLALGVPLQEDRV